MNACGLLVVHVGVGGATLALAPAAMLVKKGGAWHRRLGRLYVGAMMLVCASAAGISLWRGSPAMLMVTLLPFYLLFSGWRRGAEREPSSVDRGFAVATLAATLAAAAAAIAATLQGDADALANLPIGIAALAYCVVDLVAFRRPAPPPRTRLVVHGTRLALSYVATVSAFLITNVRFVPPLVVSVVPPLAGIAAVVAWRLRLARRAPATFSLDAARSR